jgi:SOS-response transcriptional repressor LexA
LRGRSVVDLQGLIQREICEGLTEEELASAIGVPAEVVTKTLVGEFPDCQATWEKFALYFRMHVDYLRFGGPLDAEGLFELSEQSNPSPLGQMRTVPLLKWDQIVQVVTLEEPHRLIHAKMLLETGVPGKRTFALQVRDNSMQPLFSRGEVIFVDPDVPSSYGDYVVVESEDGRPERALLRQLENIGGQVILHPLHKAYTNLPLTKQQRILGRVMQVRKNL